MEHSSLILLFVFFFNLFLILNFSKIKLFNINLDKPDNVRKTHIRPTPLAGGLILFLNILIYYVIFFFSKNFSLEEVFFSNFKILNVFFITSFIVFILGFIDDKLNLNANLKFFVLIFIILFFLQYDEVVLINELKFSFYNEAILLNDYNTIFTIFCFLVFLNAFNMFDGINLQSTFYSLLVLLSILFLYTNTFFIKLLIIFLITFSYLNFKNKSFLGDSGTLLLGFIISFLFIKLYNLNYIKYADDVVIFMLIPGLDLIRLFITRIINKRNPLSPDRLHLHHLLIKKYSLNKTLLIICLLVFIPIFLNFININNILIIILSIILYSLIIIKTNYKI